MKNINVTLSGISPIMFDAFRGQETTPPEKKLYLDLKTKNVILPASNIVGFLTSKSSVSCLRQFVSNKDWKVRSPELIGNIAVNPMRIPFLDADNNPIRFNGTWSDKIYLDESMARPSATARVMASRPVLDIPWKLTFDLIVNETEFVKESMIKDWFERGGIGVGLCAWRPLFGRFEVLDWNVS